MKPLKLELQAFGPYVNKQIVDFEKLSEKGIFLIKGNTGSGKTTIFDAMTFALYGGGSGENEKIKAGRNDLEEWRCTQADKTLETFVSFWFSSHGRQYVFKRSLVKKVKNCAEHYEAGEVDEDGNIIPFFENPKKDDLTKKATELIGLTKEQFRQVVLLPQGQFEKFLTASSGDKEEILQKIFGSEQWSEYARIFYEKAAGRKTQLDEEKREIQRSLEEDGVQGISELSQKIEDLKSEQELTVQAHKEFNGAERQDQLNRDIRLSEQFRPFHELKKKERQLEQKLPEIEKKRVEYDQAERAESLRSMIVEYEKSSLAYKERIAAMDKLIKQIETAAKAEAEVKISLENQEKNSPVEAIAKQIGSYEEKRRAYEELGDLTITFKKAEKEWKTAENNLDSAKKEYEAAENKAKRAKELFDSADAAAKICRDKYFAGIYGEIAVTLAEGEKCPVCGSRNHPEPAMKLPDSVSKQELEKREKEAEQNRKIWDREEKERAEADERKTKCREIFSAKTMEKETARTKLETAGNNLVEGIADLKGLETKIRELKSMADSYSAQTDLLRQKHTGVLNNLTDLRGKHDSAREEKEIAEKKYHAATDSLGQELLRKGYDSYLQAKSMLADDSVRRKLHEEIVGYETSCRENALALKGKLSELCGMEEPDAGLFETRQAEIRNENNAFQAKDAGLKTMISRLEDKQETLSKKFRHYSENIMQAESDLAFAKKLRGDTGIGLQRYVLAIMFSQVISEANRMLSKVHGGRYHLFRTDDRAGGNKRGLELKVHDSRCPENTEGRGVSMLSGGEKFLVSLALSIGMSTVAQKSGVQIEALFIDEGFGTLDDSSINDAMDILDSVRKGNGMIGIISHVQLLESNIPTHLEVIKSESGSKIQLN